ncbi:hypothetical protein NEFER03_1379 [Nematocida sp. LUAm3]|nr:hypothetical protein NEFER03_1379 [Nematocida sp. LUAm3]KAI5174791.1 hypothetical protein NEFER02_0901 [Nematocida sp. LUAm2]KAI5177798.1 hypothetical protein NEFER01_1000 [Nematocida sp. LUAm1]
MPSAEEPYHYLQKKVSSIIEELTNELNENISEFKKIAKEVYEVEEKILVNRSSYIKARKEIEEEQKRQQETEGVLDYFEAEIEKIRETLHTTTSFDGKEKETYSTVGDIDMLISEFNSLISSLDMSVPNRIGILLNENINLINYADALIQKIIQKRQGKETV